MATDLPPDLARLYTATRPAILARLADFAAVPQSEWFYELCYCLLTPQSRAAHAGLVVAALKEQRFFEDGGDMLHLLRNKETYIRFHNVKHRRLHAVRERWSEIERLLESGRTGIPGLVSTGIEAASSLALRDTLVRVVGGFGMKEASHFLRNIGFRGLAILDRHLLTNLVRCGVYAEVPLVSTPARYRLVEQAFLKFADDAQIDLDELDLLFWSAQTGIILK